MSVKQMPVSHRARELAAILPWHRAALVAILALSAFLELFRITREGYSNPYYAATVKSMLTSWHNFFFASYDPGGFVTVDKPPLGFWIQAASAKLFGFQGWSLLLPQALAAVLSVALLYYLVRRTFGPVAGLLAALTLALTPITVATARNNTVDCLLVLVLLIAAWAVIRAAETGRLRWLVLCAVLVGLGFNIKMLQAYLLVPAFFLLYLLAAPRRWRTRVAHLTLATIVLLGVSLSWAVAVDLTPADGRPYVGGSENNTVLSLIVGYNGLERLIPGNGKIGSITKHAKAPSPAAPSTQNAGGKDGKSGDDGQSTPGQGTNLVAIGGGAGGEAGKVGPLRLLNQQLAGQVGWMLPLAVLGLMAASWRTPFRWGGILDRRHQALLLWGTWLLTAGAFFSVAGFWHRYYLVMLSPAIAALVGVGVVALWEDYRWSKWRWWVLPVTLLGMAALHVYILADYTDWSRRLSPAIVGLCTMAATALVVARLSTRLRMWARPEIAAATGMFALLIAPAAWVAITLCSVPGDMLPYAGPSAFKERGVKSNSKAVQVGLGETESDPKLVRYLSNNRGDARFLVAVQSAAEASPLILATGEAVMALGGFGADQILTTDDLARLVASGELRFLLLPGEGELDSMIGGKAGSPPPKLGKAPTTGTASGTLQAAPPKGKANLMSKKAADGLPVRNGIVGWVQENCAPVPPERWQSEASNRGGDGVGTAGGLPGGSVLYDCGGRAR